MTRPAVFASQFPPAEDNLRGAIMLRLASGGADADELADDFAVMAEDFSDYFPHDTPVSPEGIAAVVDEVVAEYQRVVTVMSPDAAGLMAALDRLLEANILFSYGDGFEPAESMEYVEHAFEHIAAEGGRLRGYLYSTIADLDQLVLTSRLEVSFGVFDAEADTATELANDAVGLFRAAGLQASWSGDPDAPIVIEPMIVDAPLVDEDHACTCGDVGCGEGGCQGDADGQGGCGCDHGPEAHTH